MKFTRTKSSSRRTRVKEQSGRMEGSKKSSDASQITLSPDQVCEAHADQGVKVKLIQMDDEDDKMVLIEGEPAALEFLGNLLLAQAKAKDCGFQLSPTSAGKALFEPSSTLGIYIPSSSMQKATWD